MGAREHVRLNGEGGMGSGSRTRARTAEDVRRGAVSRGQAGRHAAHSRYADGTPSSSERGASARGQVRSGRHQAAHSQRQSGRDTEALPRRSAGGRRGRAESAAKAPAPARPKSRYIPSLDGLRAFAVLAVIAYHMGMPWAAGGLLGVTIFFVLSGYLITSLLVIEFQGTGRINLPDFWLRRIRRLFPAIVFSVVTIAVLCTIFNHALLTKLRPDVIPSLLFFNNWWQIFHNVSYFDALGSPSPVTHFWSLAIEEQFYLIWPVLLFIMMKLGVKKRVLGIMTLVLALLSAIDMAVLFDPHGDPSRVYYGTDTRAFSLLIGAWLAFVWPSNQLGAADSVRISTNARRALDGVGILAFVGLVLMVAFCNGFSPFLYYGGLVLCSVLTAIVIAVLVHPASLLSKFWGLPPFVWIGKRSYGIYLWHYPILLLMVPQNGLSETPWWMLLLALAVIFAISAFSYTFVENPIRHGAIGALLADIANRRTTFVEWVRSHVVHVVVSVALVLTAIGGLIFVPDTSALEGGDLLKDESAQIAGPTAGALAESSEDAHVTPANAKLDILMIGDSVSVRAIPNFQETFPLRRHRCGGQPPALRGPEHLPILRRSEHRGRHRRVRAGHQRRRDRRAARHVDRCGGRRQAHLADQHPQHDVLDGRDEQRPGARRRALRERQPHRLVRPLLVPRRVVRRRRHAPFRRRRPGIRGHGPFRGRGIPARPRGGRRARRAQIPPAIRRRQRQRGRPRADRASPRRP